MRSLKYTHPASGLGRLVRDFIQTSIGRISSVFLLLAIPFLLMAAPQQAAESSTHPAAAAQANNREAAATNFPQLPYQGTPAELPQDQGDLGLRLMLRRLGTTVVPRSRQNSL